MKSVVRIFCVVALAAVAARVLIAQQVFIPIEPAKQFGTGVTPSYEGWFNNPDGSRTFLIGYLNRNRSLEVDIPIGPNNHIDPGGPDLGQPTHFLSGRQTGIFAITVPKDFTQQQRLTWTLTINGQTNSIPFRLHADYNIEPLKDAAVGNTPPVLRFVEGGPSVQGPVGQLSKAVTRSTAVSASLTIPAWVEDDALYTTGTGSPLRGNPSPATLRWSKYRGTGTVTFDKPRPEMEKLQGGNQKELFKGKGTTSVKFGEPGEYVLHVTANDYTGDGGRGELCCWTNSMVKVTVTP